jgi:hypothetical protein
VYVVTWVGATVVFVVKLVVRLVVVVSHMSNICRYARPWWVFRIRKARRLCPYLCIGEKGPLDRVACPLLEGSLILIALILLWGRIRCGSYCQWVVRWRGFALVSVLVSVAAML